MKLHDFMAEIQSYPEARNKFSIRVFNPVISIKQPFLIPFGNTDPLIFNAQRHFFITGKTLYLYGLPGLRVLYRIGNQIYQHMFELFFIRRNGNILTVNHLYVNM